MKINFIGLGKLGLPLATCFGKNEVSVNAIDKNSELIENLKVKKAPWFEAGLQENILYSHDKMIYSLDYSKIEEIPMSVILVNTPSIKKDGSFSNIYVEQVLLEIGKRMKKGHIIVLSSTVMPGSIMESFIPLVENVSGLSLQKGEFGFAHVPDFVALGNIIKDFENPDFLVIGADCEKTFEKVKGLYSKILKNDPPILMRTLPETELIKVSLNAYITTKISFANFIGLMAENMRGDINVNNVTSAVGLDKRIGTKYFSAGASYGGTCFPRDTWAFIKAAEKAGLSADQMHANEKINQKIDNSIFNKVVNSELNTVVFLGASFKPGTSVVTEGLTIKLLSKFLKRNYEVVIYDENIESLSNLRNEISGDYQTWNSVIELQGLENFALILTIPEKKHIKVANGLQPSLTIDPWNILIG